MWGFWAWVILWGRLGHCGVIMKWAKWPIKLALKALWNLVYGSNGSLFLGYLIKTKYLGSTTAQMLSGSDLFCLSKWPIWPIKTSSHAPVFLAPRKKLLAYGSFGSIKTKWPIWPMSWTGLNWFELVCWCELKANDPNDPYDPSSCKPYCIRVCGSHSPVSLIA